MLAAQKLKSLFTEYGLTKQDLFVAVKQTEWGELHNEILELEIKKGKDEIDAGYYTTIETKAELETFFGRVRLELRFSAARWEWMNLTAKAVHLTP